jgi:hypothetical protein
MQTRRRGGNRSRKSKRSANNESGTKLDDFFAAHPKRSLRSLYSHFMISPRGRIAIFLITPNDELIDLSFRMKNGRLMRLMESVHSYIKEYRNATILERFKYKPFSGKNDSKLKELESRFLNMYPPQKNSIERYVAPEINSIQSLNM